MKGAYINYICTRLRKSLEIFDFIAELMKKEEGVRITLYVGMSHIESPDNVIKVSGSLITWQSVKNIVIAACFAPGSQVSQWNSGFPFFLLHQILTPSTLRGGLYNSCSQKYMSGVVRISPPYVGCPIWKPTPSSSFLDETRSVSIFLVVPSCTWS